MPKQERKKNVASKKDWTNQLTTRNISLFTLFLIILGVAIYIAVRNGTGDQVAKRNEFLKKKGVMANKPDLREKAFYFLNYPNKAPNKERQEYFQSCQGRIDRVLRREGDVLNDSIPLEVQTFESFCELAPEWENSDKSYVFFRDDPTVKGKNVLAQRAQLSGLCYIHGPDMLQHYLVSKNTKQSAGMIDISKLIRETFDGQQLEDHIFKDYGGSSENMLEYILEPGSIVSSTEIGMAEQRLKEFGPLLVSRFKVFDDFYNRNVHKHHGEPSGACKGLHAMVMIGARTDEKGKKFFLLQNWWKAKQFIEVDEEYLKKSRTTLYYVETPQYSIPNKFSVDYAKFAENENLDKVESFPELEGPVKGMFD